MLCVAFPMKLCRPSRRFHPWPNAGFLFALSLEETGIDAVLCALISHLRRNPDSMEGAAGAILIDGAGELYTKQLAQTLALAANGAGCSFSGKAPGGSHRDSGQLARAGAAPGPHPAGGLPPGRSRAGTNGCCPLRPGGQSAPNILMLHASDRSTSNTLALGHAVCERLEPACITREISLQNGTIYDCRGCSYTTCAHFAAQNTCFYGGSNINEVHPAIMDCDALLLLCPKLQRLSVSANIMACINRLTSLLVFNTLYEKYLYAIVVSGYSGSDLVAQQVLGALCFNKTFMLPSRFCMMETANNPGEALHLSGIQARIEAFSQSILRTVWDGSH